MVSRLIRPTVVIGLSALALLHKEAIWQGLTAAHATLLPALWLFLGFLATHPGWFAFATLVTLLSAVVALQRLLGIR